MPHLLPGRLSIGVQGGAFGTGLMGIEKALVVLGVKAVEAGGAWGPGWHQPLPSRAGLVRTGDELQATWFGCCPSADILTSGPAAYQRVPRCRQGGKQRARK